MTAEKTEPLIVTDNSKVIASLEAEIERLKSERDELLKLVEAYAKDKP